MKATAIYRDDTTEEVMISLSDKGRKHVAKFVDGEKIKLTPKHVLCIVSSEGKLLKKYQIRSIKQIDLG